VFIGLFGGIIASGDFLSGGFSVVVGILFLSFSHKMKEIIKEQTIEKNEDATIQNPDKENVIENKIDIDDLIKKSVNITGPTLPRNQKKQIKRVQLTLKLVNWLMITS
ncbi:DNA polymerase III subunit epsilon, partial [Enterococcus faecium]|nr:DNA polymerase III subunit epsilon [Enterococcus faecium]